jgi:hypothetical protein
MIHSKRLNGAIAATNSPLATLAFRLRTFNGEAVAQARRIPARSNVGCGGHRALRRRDREDYAQRISSMPRRAKLRQARAAGAGRAAI